MSAIHRGAIRSIWPILLYMLSELWRPMKVEGNFFVPPLVRHSVVPATSDTVENLLTPCQI